MAGGTDSVTIEHLQEMAPGNFGHVTLKLKGRVVTQMYWDANIPKTVRDMDSVPMGHQ